MPSGRPGEVLSDAEGLPQRLPMAGAASACESVVLVRTAMWRPSRGEARRRGVMLCDGLLGFVAQRGAARRGARRRGVQGARGEETASGAPPASRAGVWKSGCAKHTSAQPLTQTTHDPHNQTPAHIPLPSTCARQHSSTTPPVRSTRAPSAAAAASSASPPRYTRLRAASSRIRAPPCGRRARRRGRGLMCVRGTASWCRGRWRGRWGLRRRRSRGRIAARTRGHGGSGGMILRVMISICRGGRRCMCYVFYSRSEMLVRLADEGVLHAA